ncbi:flotillin family protein [Ruficoccus amylovorans]|uniref:Flotillin family protein n=1 Tax=Ruficoccus amylovorans TaxID=1804625 RepID=A0A842HJD3_9BACT|nr:flotillin domain-containing protein [Ruficoccus amylovorans]MBC2595271.1 flotillin family protein [Ruficoccus amylovorans]
MNILIWVGIAFAALVFFGVAITRLYKRSSKEIAFVRTGLGGEKVILDGGAIKLPVFQEIVAVNMRTLRLQVDRKNEDGLITADRMRVDVTAEFYVRVRPEKESIAKAAQTLGDRTLQPEMLKELLQGKFVDALRAVAAGLSMEQLHEQRAEFVQSVQSSVSEDLLKNGLELESVSLTALDQTGRAYFKEDNAFDAQGLAKLTLITEAKREERNRIEQDTRVKIETKNLEAARQSFHIKRDEEMARLDQEREVAFATASQEALVATEKATRKREAEESRIVQEQKEKEAAITADQAIKERDIHAKRQVEEADIERHQSVEIKKQTADIAVAKKSEEQSGAEAEAAKARALMVREEENVVTVRQTSVANREKEIQLIKAREAAEKDAIDVKVAAEAEKQAALDKAEAAVTEAKAQAERIRIVAEADHKRLEVEAYGEKAINEAKNLLSQEIISFEIRKILAQVAPQIIEASVKPMEKIDSIKIVSTNGFHIPGSNGGGNGGTADGSGSLAPATGGMPNQLMESLLAYRMNSPIVDKLLHELGIDPSRPGGLSSDLADALDGGREKSKKS